IGTDRPSQQLRAAWLDPVQYRADAGGGRRGVDRNDRRRGSAPGAAVAAICRQSGRHRTAAGDVGADLGPGVTGDHFGAGGSDRHGRRARPAPPRPARRRGSVGRRSAGEQLGGADRHHRRRPAAARQPPDQASRPLPDAGRGRASQGLSALIGEVGLAAAVTAFVGSHFALSHPLRLGLVRSLGEARFTLLYSAVALLTFMAILIAYRSVGESYPLWIAPRWGYWVAAALMLFASILLVGSVIRNPAFPHPGAEKLAWQPPAGVFAITRHPMNWSFATWAI